MSGRQTSRHVALAYPLAVPWMALFMRGVADYARQEGGWTFTTSPPTLTGAEEFAHTVYSLRGWPGDGVIAAISNRAEAEAARRLGVPVVNLAGALREVGLPRVMVDHYAIGRIAAEHLLECGLRRLAYYGVRGLYYSQQRRRGFVERAEEAGVAVVVFEAARGSNRRQSWQSRIGRLDEWLSRLPRPVGILAVHDYRARALVDECQRLKLRIPEDVAVLGVDNDPTICEFCQPTLSSVSRSAWRVGYETAALLGGLMDGKPPPEDDLLVPPDGVVARQSTDTLALEDPHLVAAMRYVRDHLLERHGIGEIARVSGVSRRQLELRFREVLRCTPYDYVCRLRLERAKQLLAGPDRLKHQFVANACGFASSHRLRLVFRRYTGLTPEEYRRQAGCVKDAPGGSPAGRIKERPVSSSRS